MKRNGASKKPSCRGKKVPSTSSDDASPSFSSPCSSSGEIILGHLCQLSPYLPALPSSASASSQPHFLTFKSTKLYYSIGDSSSCDYVLSDPHISSQHCNISITPMTPVVASSMPSNDEAKYCNCKSVLPFSSLFKSFIFYPLDLI
jgi:hypothetical protein